MIPATYDLTLYKGDTRRLTVTLKEGPDLLTLSPINLTGATALAQIRATKSSGTVMASFTCTLTGTPTDGKVNLLLPAAQADLLQTSGGFWDLQVTRGGGDIETYLSGAVEVLEDVSRTP